MHSSIIFNGKMPVKMVLFNELMERSERSKSSNQSTHFRGVSVMAEPNLISFTLTDKRIRKFWSRAKVNPLTGCLEWQKGKSSRGYGIIQINNKTYFAHRVAYFLYHHTDLAKVNVLHSCDNPCCIAKEHLFLGTHADNVADMVRKGRNAKGDRQGARLHPETVRRGDNHHARLRPECMARGERHGSRTKPESLPRGDQHWSKRLPDRILVGENHPRATLKEAQVLEIRARWGANKGLLALLGKEFGVTEHTVWDIVSRKTWKHI